MRTGRPAAASAPEAWLCCRNLFLDRFLAAPGLDSSASCAPWDLRRKYHQSTDKVHAKHQIQNLTDGLWGHALVWILVERPMGHKSCRYPPLPDTRVGGMRL